MIQQIKVKHLTNESSAQLTKLTVLLAVRLVLLSISLHEKTAPSNRAVAYEHALFH
ncbi:hypothetical protein JOC27_002647 [Sporolactobacillus spathodeae]|uniref:Uncharacterized protein n=1 Tax=Sporolactobacillus spathodeae TaxID=1465502 RepID=A0ABS2QDY9_9BACL|nr:hypothetical protein [Sporolactobacillus spathodeae]